MRCAVAAGVVRIVDRGIDYAAIAAYNQRLYDARPNMRPSEIANGVDR